jgi:hypothetical protein
MKFKVECWYEWDDGSTGWNASGTRNYIDVELECDDESKIKEKLIASKILEHRNQYRVLSVKI